MTVFAMTNPVMAYAWGSHDSIAALQHRDRSVGPEAELWMGAHPHASSTLVSAGGEVALDAAIAADPLMYLGEQVLARFGPRLPFLLKVLAAAEPLSLQVHPDPARARSGFEAEDAAGIDRSAPERSYRDPYAKPEMIVALDRFEAMQGFRPAAEAAALLRAIGAPLLGSLGADLVAGLTTGAAFMRLVEWPAVERPALVEQLLAGARAARITAPGEPAFRWIEALATSYPGDSGAAAPALLNYVLLEPGRALLIAPGEIHAYLRGTGVEILGGSDNVIRGGLTPKHVSVRDLRDVLDLASRAPAVAGPTLEGAEEFWPAPFEEFELSRLVLDGAAVALPRRGPEIDLCLAGTVSVSDASGGIDLAAGDSAFATAAGGELTASGSGVLIRATPRRDDPVARSAAGL
jgi:mannose-6-phosphate isomerase